MLPKNRDLLSGKPLGHPAHPALVVLPMGSLLSATALDLLAGRQARPAARRLIAVGLLTAVPTAATGASDWLDTDAAERRVGLAHWTMNALGLGLYAGSWLARGRDRRLRATSLALLGAGVLGGSGWLGGHLAYALGVGVDTTAFTHLAATWTDVGSASDVEAPGSSMLGWAENTPVLVINTARGLRAMADRCTHRGAPLHEGDITDDCVICPWHGSAFAVDNGQVVSGPATRPQPTFEVQRAQGRVQVRRINESRALRTNPI